jgi:hypothetical protein
MLRCGFDGASTDWGDALLVLGVNLCLVLCAAAAGSGSHVTGKKPGDVRAGCRDERQHYGDDCAHR